MSYKQISKSVVLADLCQYIYENYVLFFLLGLPRSRWSTYQV